jgi:hypothetical protein
MKPAWQCPWDAAHGSSPTPQRTAHRDTAGTSGATQRGGDHGWYMGDLWRCYIHISYMCLYKYVHMYIYVITYTYIYMICLFDSSLVEKQKSNHDYIHRIPIVHWASLTTRNLWVLKIMGKAQSNLDGSLMDSMTNIRVWANKWRCQA